MAADIECSSGSGLKPVYGMEFDSEEDAYDFYNMYGRSMGFSIRRESHAKSYRTGEITSRIFVCSKHGFRSKDKRDDLTITPRSHTRIGCDAQLGIKLDRNKNKYCVNNFVEMHNHPLVKSECVHMLPSQRKMAAPQIHQADLAQESGISLKTSYELMGRQAGGRESIGFTKLDQKNYLRTKRQNTMAYGEAGYLLKYFSEQTLLNPSFFYSIQLDNEEQITNIFWADARMIIDYGQFGDVVSFDTTYKVNKENRPFGVFVGFNHHRETIIFGGALMYDETINSFVWLFETFLRAMSGKAPKTMFTDQDAAMANAIGCVMPNTYHRLCTWHIMHNALRHVNTVFKGPGGVKSVLSRFMHYIEEEEELLTAWNNMLEEYGVQNNNWLRSIFELRNKWAYAYVRWSWSAEMKSTQLSESFNASLKGYLRSDLNVSEFFMHFERMVNDKRYKELEAEYDSCYRLVNMKISVKMLSQAREVYTKSIFKDFQDQFEESVDLLITDCNGYGANYLYTVTDEEPFSKRLVKREGDNLSCSCRLFEIKGILCSHLMKVLREAMHIKEIPEQYILNRWTKQARAESVQDMHGREIQTDPKLKQTSRYRSLCSTYIKISGRASESEKASDVAHEYAIIVARAIEDILRLEITGNRNDVNHEFIQAITVEDECARDVNIVQPKGLKKKETSRGRRRFKSSVEIALERNRKLAIRQARSQTSKASTKLVKKVRKTPTPLVQYHPRPSDQQLLQQTSFQELHQQTSIGLPFASQDS